MGCTKEETNALMRVQVAMWLKDYPHEDPQSSCFACRRPYKSVDDFLDRNPRAGGGFGKNDREDWFIDDECFWKLPEDHALRQAVLTEGTDDVG